MSYGMILARAFGRGAAAVALVAGLGGAAAAEVELRAVASGVYVVQGALAEPAPANQGRVSNLGVIVGAEGAITIGTGTSDAEAEALLAAIGRLTDRPVVLGINTHAAPDQVLGNGAFARRGIPVLAHRETDRFMVQNCDACVRNLKKSLGDAALGATGFTRPTRLVDGGEVLRIGGREIELLHYGWSAQPGSVAVYDRASRVLFAGDLASIDRIPEVQAANIDGWLAALKQLRETDAAALVPAHGPVSKMARLAELTVYLEQLSGAVVRAYEGGVGILEAADRVELANFRSWALYEPVHRKNVHFVYLRVEARDFTR